MIGRVFGGLILVVLAAVAPLNTAYCKTIYVRTDGNDANNGDSWATAKQTVNAAMDAAAASDSIWVARGVYQVGTLTMRNGVYLNGGFRGDETYFGQRDPTTYASVLNGDSNGPVVFVPGSVSTWISGFTIRNGNGYLIPELSDTFGGGIYCQSHSSAFITNCIIEHNKAYYGGGIFCSGGQGSSLVIKYSIIRNNSATFHGGIALSFISATIANNIIQENDGIWGGGISCQGDSPTITNNTIIHNFGTGIYCYADAVISNNIIAYNTYGIDASLTSNPVLRNNCVYGNDYDYSEVTPGQGDISQDPMFTLPPSEGTSGSCHILLNSPCIDAGWNEASTGINDDIDAEPRVNGGTVDIGADEYWPSKTYYVNGAAGSDSKSGLSWELAKKTIGAALKPTKWHDQIWVAKGTYVEHITLKRSVQLYGGFLGNETAISQRPSFPRPTPDPNASILDGNLEDTVVTSMSGAFQSSIIDGFVIRKGYGSQGGGIACFNDSDLLIRNNTIRENSAGDGGGVYCEYSSPQLLRNIISNNVAYDRGGGIFIFDVLPPNLLHHPEISQCIITLNTAQSGDGGGIFCTRSGPDIHNSLIARNKTFGAGGGIRITESLYHIFNNLISLNKAGYGGGIHIYDGYGGSIANNTITANSVTQFGGGIDFVSSKYLTIENNIVVQNTMGIGQYGTENNVTLKNNDVWGNTYMDYYAVSPGTGDISADPQFVDSANGDYHLTQFSPCINAGTNDANNIGSYDIDGQPRIGNSIVDIGADERQPLLPPHKIIIDGPIVRPQTAKPGEFVYCNIGAQDSYGQNMIYEWSDGGAGGYFSEPFTQAPIYVAPQNAGGQNKKIVLTCFVASNIDQSVSESASVELTVESVSIPGDFTGDGQVTISDATLFVNEWVRMHQTPPPAFDPAIDGPFDLYPHTAGVWPDWTPIGDSVINISDATAFIQCWTGSHPSSPASAVPMRANGH